MENPISCSGSRETPWLKKINYFYTMSFNDIKDNQL